MSLPRETYQIEIGEEADAAYVRVLDRPIVDTREVGDGIVVDFDAGDGIVGVEVLGLRERVGAGDAVSYVSGLVSGLRLRPATAAAE
jgi:uncharacterized protein YuzE